MRAWHGVLVWLALTAALRLLAGDAGVWTAPEVDTLEAGVSLAEQLTSSQLSNSQQTLGARLDAGFTPGEGQPRAAAFPEGEPWRRAVAEPPVPKWLAALSVMMAPSGEVATNAARAATGAAAILALAATLLLAGLWRHDRVVASVAGVALLLQPGALDAAAGAGYGAVAALTMVWLSLAMLRLGERQGGGLSVGLAWGLALGVHPGVAFLILPIFSAFAIARGAAVKARAQAQAQAHPQGLTPAGGAGAVSGMIGLPLAPLSLMLTPFIGIAALVALWPALWQETAKRLGAWLMDNWWLFNPAYDVAGQVFDQAHGRAAMAWTPLVQWAGWLAVPLLIGFVAGVLRVARAGREGLWFPLLAWLTLTLVGAADGGLYGGRLSLMPLLWAPAAIVIGQGARALLDLGRRRLPGHGRRLAVGGALLGLGVPLIGALAGVPLAPWRQTGLGLLYPLPTALLRDLARVQPGSRVLVRPTPAQWRPAIAAARDHLELPLRWAETPRAADWIIEIGERAAEPPASEARAWWSGGVYGLAVRVTAVGAGTGSEAGAATGAATGG